MKQEKTPKCKTCTNFTDNNSGICNQCLEKKYKLFGESTYDSDDSYKESPLIPLYIILMILDEIEVNKIKERTQNTIDDKTLSKLLFDYWMYDVADKALNDSLEREMTSYGSPEHYNKMFHKFKNVKFHDLGKLNLSIQKLREVKEEHDKLLKRLLGIKE